MDVVKTPGNKEKKKKKSNGFFICDETEVGKKVKEELEKL